MQMPVFSHTKKVLFSLTFVSASLHAEHGEIRMDAKVRPEASTHLEEVKAIFQNKCSTCHDGDGKFGNDGFPAPEFKQQALDAMRGKHGVKPMPPMSAEQLTEDEMAKINEWANDGETSESLADFCAKPNPMLRPKMAIEIFSDRCVTCHGKLSFNPTSVLRSAHTQFLDNDGKFDESALGDVSEVPGYAIPWGKTSIGRILDSLTNNTMPPRGNLPVLNKPSENLLPEMGTPHMTDGERTYLRNYLNDRKRRENCPITETAWGMEKKKATKGTFKYRDAVKYCYEQGMRIPTRAQVLTIGERFAEELIMEKSEQNEFCVWTSTFGEALTGDKKIPLRKVFQRNKDNGIEDALKGEKEKCRLLCVK